jgi:acetyl esterase/lipase
MLSRRHFMILAGAAAAGARLPGSAAAAATKHSVDGVNPMAVVNPEFRGALRKLPEQGRFGVITRANLPKLRAMVNDFATPVRRVPQVVKRVIPGFDKDPNVPIYVIGAEPGAVKPAVLHIHGGGFIAGSARGNIGLTQRIAAGCDCVVVAPEYRLAPETPFPGPLNDNYAALLWMYAHAREVGVDPDRIAVMGESAGGGLAAMLAIAARNRRQVPIVLQVLIYPMLDDRTGSTHSVPGFMGQFIWTRQNNRFGWSAFLGEPAGSVSVPPGSVPARVRNLAGLPPAYIGVGSIDLFANEDIEYAKRLMDSAVPTELLVIPGGFHAFDFIAPDALLSKEFTHAWQNALRRAFVKT